MTDTPQICFVLPVLNEAGRIGPLLQRLRQTFPGAELIVTDGGSTDATVTEAMPRCDKLLIGERGRAVQMNLGASTATGRYLLFLHADTEPQFDDRDLANALASAPDWGFCRLRLSGTKRSLRIVEWFINWRSRLTAIGTGDQLLFMRREVYRDIGGFDSIPLMEDVALCKRLRATGAPAVLPLTVLTSSRRWEEGGVIRTVLRMWALRLAYFLGVHPERLWRYYYGG